MTESSTSRLPVLAAIVFTVIAWASAFVVIRGVAPELGGGALALGRLLSALPVLAILVLIGRRWVRPTRGEWVRLLVYGLGWFGVYSVALNISEEMLDAGTAAMIVNIGPLLIALGGGILLREGLPRPVLLGAAVAFLGVILIGIATLTAGETHPVEPLGVVLALLAAVTYAAGVLAQKPLTARLPASQISFLGCAIGLAAGIPFSGQLVEGLATAEPAIWAGVIYLGVVPTALAFTTWGYALGRMPASRLGITTYVVPPLTIVMGLLAFGEIPPWLAVVGGAVCLVGVAVSRRRGRITATPAAGAAVVADGAVSTPARDLSE